MKKMIYFDRFANEVTEDYYYYSKQFALYNLLDLEINEYEHEEFSHNLEDLFELTKNSFFDFWNSFNRDPEGLKYLLPLFFPEVGYSANSGLSREGYERFLIHLKEINNVSVINHFTFHFDVLNMINSINSVLFLFEKSFTKFYSTLIRVDLLENGFSDDGTYIHTCSLTYDMNLFSNHFFLSFNSLLDLITKLCYEFENLEDDDSKLKIKSQRVLYSRQKKYFSDIFKEKTIFSDDDRIIHFILKLRDKIIHNTQLYPDFEIRYVLERQSVIKKYIKFPDYENNSLKKSSVRDLFFSQHNTLNDELIRFYKACHKLLSNTFIAFEKKYDMKIEKYSERMKENILFYVKNAKNIDVSKLYYGKE